MANDLHTLKEVAALAVCLTPEDKIRLIEIVASALERDLTAGEFRSADSEAATQSVDLAVGSVPPETRAQS